MKISIVYNKTVDIFGKTYTYLQTIVSATICAWIVLICFDAMYASSIAASAYFGWQSITIAILLLVFSSFFTPLIAGIILVFIILMIIPILFLIAITCRVFLNINPFSEA